MLGLSANSRPVVGKKSSKQTIHTDPHHITSKFNTPPPPSTTWALCFTVLVVDSLVLS